MLVIHKIFLGYFYFADWGQELLLNWKHCIPGQVQSGQGIPAYPMGAGWGSGLPLAYLVGSRPVFPTALGQIQVGPPVESSWWCCHNLKRENCDCNLFKTTWESVMVIHSAWQVSDTLLDGDNSSWNSLMTSYVRFGMQILKWKSSQSMSYDTRFSHTIKSM